MKNTNVQSSKCEQCKEFDILLHKVTKCLNGAYHVRSLDWITHGVVPNLLTADSFFGKYIIYRSNRDFHYELIGTNFTGNSDELFAAKQACEINFHGRLKPILQPATLTVR